MTKMFRNEFGLRCVSPNYIRDELLHSGIFGEPSGEIPWRLSSEPFPVSPAQMEFFLLLGQDLLEFYRAVDALVLDSSCGKLPSWVLNYLMMRIDAPVKEMGLSKAMRGQTVRVIRPDVILTKDGKTITELDSVPGGIGWTAALNAAYEKAGFDVVGAGGQMEKGFARMLADVAGVPDPYCGIVVSEESKDYWHEMVWLGKRLESLGQAVEVLRPEELKACHGKICGKRDRKFNVLYRFF